MWGTKGTVQRRKYPKRHIRAIAIGDTQLAAAEEAHAPEVDVKKRLDIFKMKDKKRERGREGKTERRRRRTSKGKIQFEYLKCKKKKKKKKKVLQQQTVGYYYLLRERKVKRDSSDPSV